MRLIVTAKETKMGGQAQRHSEEAEKTVLNIQHGIGEQQNAGDVRGTRILRMPNIQ